MRWRYFSRRELFFKSHLTPWQLVFTLQEIDFNKFDTWVASFSPKQGWTSFFRNKELKKAIVILIILIICYGLLGGGMVLLFLRVHPSSRLFRNGILTSLLVIVLLISSTILSFDSRFTEQIHYQGVMASAPWIINMFSNGMEVIKHIGKNLKRVSNEFPLLSKQAEQIKNLENSSTDLRVLHVSDIHNNPAAIDLISELAVDFKINLIIDTGDITDYGTPFEIAIIQRIASLNIPYLFIPGNHDSPLVINRLRKLRTVKVLTNGFYKTNGLTIAGFADPASFNFSSNIASETEINKACEELTSKVLKESIVPDIVAVHNVKLAAEIIGKVPVILHGHDHRYRLNAKEDTIINDAGTTGAAGLRGLIPEGVSYSASILYWGKNDEGILKLRMIDSIKINGLKGLFTIDRQSF